MPRTKSILEGADDVTETRALAEAEADIAAGRVVPHEEIVKWLQSWDTDNELPCPEHGAK